MAWGLLTRDQTKAEAFGRIVRVRSCCSSFNLEALYVSVGKNA